MLLPLTGYAEASFGKAVVELGSLPIPTKSTYHLSTVLLDQGEIGSSGVVSKDLSSSLLEI